MSSQAATGGLGCYSRAGKLLPARSKYKASLSSRGFTNRMKAMAGVVSHCSCNPSLSQSPLASAWLASTQLAGCEGRQTGEPLGKQAEGEEKKMAVDVTDQDI